VSAGETIRRPEIEKSDRHSKTKTERKKKQEANRQTNEPKKAGKKLEQKSKPKAHTTWRSQNKMCEQD